MPEIWICPEVALEMPIWPPTAFFGVNGSAALTAAPVVGPAARLAKRTGAQNSWLSSVAAVGFQGPLMTPLPSPFAHGAAQAVPRCPAAPAAFESSPGNALNLSWYAYM